MVLPDEIHLPGHFNASIPAKHMLIFFVPGNPGLVTYYSHFLHTLRSLLYSTASPQSQIPIYHIHGSSLPGFDISRSVPDARLPLSLNQQVDHVHTRLQQTVLRIAEDYTIQPQHVNVILIGHSIGAYMCLDVTSRIQKLGSQSQAGQQLNVVASLCLFPTVFELDKSPMGRKVGPLTRIPLFAPTMHYVCKLLFSLTPSTVLARLVRFITAMPPSPAHITAEFLQSRWGVWQALHMARDELAQLTHDTWSDDFWGGTARIHPSSPDAIESALQDSARPPQPKLFFYWGANDHWVAQSTRDELIARRARVRNSQAEASRPVMHIDRNGIGHAFCLRDEDARLVAEKCASWIEDGLEKERGA